MAELANKEFGKRKPVAIPAAHTAKRSGHVALLLMGTVAVGGGAYALMPGENCEPNRPGMASGAECAPRGASSGTHSSSGSSRYGFFNGDSSTSRSASASTSVSGSDGVTRGGFGSFGRAFMAHFSVGG
jgi:hypothetical protein